MKRTYYPHYYSIDDIFVTQERVPCTAEQDLKNLGFLDPSSETNDIKTGQNLELPLWYILQVQKDRSRNQFRVNIPDIYKSTYGEICRADATAIDLGKLNKYYYEFGRYVAAFDRNGFVGKIIYETCRSRMKYLRDLCHNTNNETRNDQKLDAIENLLYEIGCRTNFKWEQWLLCNTINIKTSEMVVNHLKRKRQRALMEAANAVVSASSQSLRS